MLKGIKSGFKSVAGAVSQATAKTEQGDVKNILKNYTIVDAADSNNNNSSSSGSGPRFVCGQQNLWKVYDALAKGSTSSKAVGVQSGGDSNGEVSVFICDHGQVADRCNGDLERKQEIIDLLKHGPSVLSRIRYPTDVLKVVEPLQEGLSGTTGPPPKDSRRLIFVTERVVATLDSLWREQDKSNNAHSSPQAGGGLTSSSQEDIFHQTTKTAVGEDNGGGQMDVTEVMYRLHRLSKTLKWLHNEAKWVLCNLNPSSIFLTAAGEWKIGDFTFAKGLETGTSDVGGEGEGKSCAQPIKWLLTLDQKDFREPLAVPPLDYVSPEVLGEAVIRPKPVNSPGGGSTNYHAPAPDDLFGGRITTAGSGGGEGSPTDIATTLTSATDVFSLGLLTHELVQRALLGSKAQRGIRVLRTADNLQMYRQQLQSLEEMLANSVAKHFVIINSSRRPALESVVSFQDPIFASPEVQMLGKLVNFSTLDEGDRFTTLKNLYQSVPKLSGTLFTQFALPPLVLERATNPTSIDRFLVPILIEGAKREDWRAVRGGGSSIFSKSIGPLMVRYLKAHETLPHTVVLQILQGLAQLRQCFFPVPLPTTAVFSSADINDEAAMAFLAVIRRALKEGHGGIFSTSPAGKSPTAALNPPLPSSASQQASLGPRGAYLVVQDLKNWQPIVLSAPSLGHDRWAKEVLGPLLELCDPSSRCLPLLVSASAITTTSGPIATSADSSSSDQANTTASGLATSKQQQQVQEVQSALELHEDAMKALGQFVDSMTTPEVTFVSGKVVPWVQAHVQTFPHSLAPLENSNSGKARLGTLEERVEPILDLANKILPRLSPEAVAEKFLPTLCPLLMPPIHARSNPAVLQLSSKVSDLMNHCLGIVAKAREEIIRKSGSPVPANTTVHADPSRTNDKTPSSSSGNLASMMQNTNHHQSATTLQRNTTSTSNPIVAKPSRVAPSSSTTAGTAAPTAAPTEDFGGSDFFTQLNNNSSGSATPAVSSTTATAATAVVVTATSASSAPPVESRSVDDIFGF